MKLKDAYKLKWFGTYWVEVDTDDLDTIERLRKRLRKICKFRFIKFIIVPSGAIKLAGLK